MPKRTPALDYPPGQIIRDKLKGRGWTQGDLAEIMGRPERLISELIGGKKEITAETAMGLATAFDEEDALYWMNLHSAYLLTITKPLKKSVGRRAGLYLRFPIRELLKRKWIEPSDNIGVVEANVCKFFRIKGIGDKLQLFHDEPVARLYVNEVIQAAWLYRARELAETVKSEAYSEHNLRDVLAELRSLLIAPEEIRNVPHMLANAGVRFVIVESLPGADVDGAVFWMNETPVIALSLRIDRLNEFWFLLRHEIEHILRRDGLVDVEVEVDLTERIRRNEAMSPGDRYANYAAAEFLVANDKCNLFISAERPLYSEQNILSFAQDIGVHPAIIVGQLQLRDGLPAIPFRKHAIKIREIITSEAVTDGWGIVPQTRKVISA